MESSSDEMKKSGSRFQVARVETSEEPRSLTLTAKNESDVDLKKSKDVSASKSEPLKCNTESQNIPNSPESPCATFSIGGESLRSSSLTDGYSNSNTKYMNTMEVLPCVDHYRNVFSATAAGNIKARPTLEELHEERDDEALRARPNKDNAAKYNGSPLNSDSPGDKPQTAFTPVRFGWIQGVLIRCVLNIFGVMLFIRLSWVVGNAGIINAILIILLSGVVTTITAISMTAICTNGEVKGGGAYYMISRSLGPEFGGAIGLIFSVANSVAVAMYVVGFAETVRDILLRHDSLITDPVNDVRIIGSITICLLLGIALVGMDWEARAQVVLLGILLLAIVDFFIGYFISPTDEKFSKGFVGPNERIVKENAFALYESGETFFSVFSVFFPAATGILAGANISGDLKNASKSIPKGTFLAILITTLVYLVLAVFLGSCVVREAHGIVPASASSNLTAAVTTTIVMTATTTTPSPNPKATLPSNASIQLPSTTIVSPSEPHTPSVQVLNVDYVQNCSLSPDGCIYGLYYDFMVTELVALWGPLISAGIFSATLSSALASLMSAPKVFQALCKDKIFPFVHYFGVGNGPNDMPRRAFILCFVIGFGFQLVGDLNAIAPLISNFFLMSYALINFSCFDASIARSPGWRPSFRFYSKWLSLAGSILCIVVMFIINWITALITFGCVGSLFIYVHHRKPDVNWGSSTQAHVYRSVLQSALKLVRIGEHIKNFRPQILVMSGEPDMRPALVDFCSHITKKTGLMVCGNVIIGQQMDNLGRLQSEAPYAYFRKRHIKSFYSACTASTFQLGTQSLMQNVGVGKFRPNLLILGYKSNWQRDKPQNVQQFLGVIHDAFDLKYGVGILRLKEGFGLDVLGPEEDGSDDDSPRETPQKDKNNKVLNVTTKDKKEHPHHPNNAVGAGNGDAIEMLDRDEHLKIETREDGTNVVSLSSVRAIEEVEEEDEEVGGNGDVHAQQINPLLLSKINTDVLKTMNKFRNKEKGTIDVWWLFDDGGLTLLLPYILTTKSHWRGCRLRVFAAGTKSGDLGYEQRQLATLLAKFRIDCKDMTILPEINKKPSEESIKLFNAYLSDWKLNTKKGETKEEFPWKTTDEELELLKEKTYRHIRLRELLQEKSKDSSLVVMTLPMPRKGTCSAGLYMCWIDALTRDMPPILLVRGNQTSVLTFYS